MDKVRISQIAKELGKTSKEIIQKAQELNFNVKAASSTLTETQATELYDYVISGKSQALIQSKEEPTKPKDSKAKKPPTKPTQAQTTPKEQEIKSPIEPKQEEQKPNIKSQETSSHIRRKGLRIIKKHDEKAIPKDEPKTQSQAPQTLHELLGNLDDAPAKKEKKKKEKKPTIQPKKNAQQQKINLLENRDIQISSDDEEEGVILFDLNIQDEPRLDDDEQEKKITTDKIKVQRHNPFMEQGSARRSSRKKIPKPQKAQEVVSGLVRVPEEIRAYEFAQKIGRSTGEVIKVLFNLGMMVTKNDFLEKDAIEILAEEFGVEIEIINHADELDYTQLDSQDNQEHLVVRAPVVTIMGHVDHGKTSLLDFIRNTKIVAAEAGGITQNIGAYSIQRNGKSITFIDTPGHEAFSEMRARGAQVTDIAVIVIAADDGVKPQTIEAFNHAKAAQAPIIIAMNKIDKPEANPDKLKAEAAEFGITPLEWGGEYEFVPISAKSGEGVDDLLETILLQAEILELKANPNKFAKAIVIESSLEKGKGPVATLIVQNGTLKVGDSIIADTAYGRVRAIGDDLGKNISQIGPSEVGVIIGLNEVPQAGSILLAVEHDGIAREYAQKRASHLRQKELSHSTKVSFDELSSMVAQGQLKSLPVIIKADTQGGLEAIRSSLEKFQNQEVKVEVIHKGVGGISESDVILAGASNCIILGFNVRPTGSVKNKAKELNVEIKTYSIIYSLMDDIKALLGGLLSPVLEEENTGQAEVRDTFSVAKIGVVAGCFVTDGTIQRGIKVRLIRDGVVIYAGNISSLKRFKDDVKEVAKGFECGIMLENYNDIQIGDVFETYKEVQKQRTL